MRQREEDDMLQLLEELVQRAPGVEELRVEALVRRQEKINQRMAARRKARLPGQPPSLAAPWYALFDHERGCWYYYNEETLATSWDPPASRGLDSSALQRPEEPPAPWRLVADESGSWYYHNTATDETGWTLPLETGNDDWEYGEHDHCEEPSAGSGAAAAPPGGLEDLALWGPEELPQPWNPALRQPAGLWYQATIASSDTGWQPSSDLGTTTGEEPSPVPLGDAAASAPRRPQEPPEPWQLVLAEAEARWYYHNTATGDTVWQLPVNVEADCTQEGGAP